MKKDIRWGISGNNDRIFVSTAFGCNFNCSYCYLKDMNIQGVQEIFKKDELLEELNQREIFIPGKQGSLVTIGCFTECWDDMNRKTTKDIINYFLKYENYIQLSTKKKIYDNDITSIIENIRHKNQMNIFVSLPILSHSKDFEPDIDDTNLRIENLSIKRKYGINTYLYIKPVIESITIKDKDRYVELIKTYQVPVVIGDVMHPTFEDNCDAFLIGNANMKELHNNDSDELAHYLEKYTRVFRHSDEAIKQIREG